MKNNSVIPTAIQTSRIRHENTETVDTSPPPSPPPIQNLYTDPFIGQGTNSTQPIALLPTRNNKASLGKTERSGKRPPLLLPKSTDLPPTNLTNGDRKKDGNNNVNRTKMQHIKRLVVHVLKQLLLKRNNLVLVINGLHQVWRARFFLTRFFRILVNYPYRQEYKYYHDTAIQLAKLLAVILKKEQRNVLVDVAHRQNKRLASMPLGALFRWLQVLVVVIWARLMGMSRVSLKAGYRMLKFFGAWDSLALAFVSVAITRSLQRPTHSG